MVEISGKDVEIKYYSVWTLKKIRGALHVIHPSVLEVFFHGADTAHQLEIIMYLAQWMFADDSDIELFLQINFASYDQRRWETICP